MNVNWDAATVIDATNVIVVIISVGLIVYQLRQQTKLTKAANAQNLVEISSPFNMQLITDRNMAELWIKGSTEYSTYDATKKYQYEALVIWWLILHENIYIQKRNRLLDNEIYTAWDNDLKEFIRIQQPEINNVWDKIKHAYSTEFVAHIDKLLSAHITGGKTGINTSG